VTQEHFGWPARLHVVTGKGGTGKTTVAAALAIALAEGGRRTLLVEVEGRQGIAQLFELPPLPYEERVVAGAPGGGEVRALAVDAEEALLEYLDLFYKLGLAGRALSKMGAIDFATTIAPGMRDVLLTGKVKEALTRSVDGRRVYDAVVLDAPPTGRVARFLNVTAETARLAKIGPIKTQSEGVAAILRSPMSTVHVVTLLEEMPVQETADAIAELTRLGLPVGSVIVNATRPPLLAGARVTQSELRRGLDAAGLDTAGLDAQRETVAGLVAEARAYQTRVDVEAALREELAGLGRPLVELPTLPDGVTREGLDRLAADLLAAR
jgi:anion-transporting  ArsA/GET3 family ATPase